MALTFRGIKGSSLSHEELDNNFRHFTGSHTVNGTITLTENLNFTAEGSTTSLTKAAVDSLLSGQFPVSQDKSVASRGSTKLEFNRTDNLLGLTDVDNSIELYHEINCTTHPELCPPGYKARNGFQILLGCKDNPELCFEDVAPANVDNICVQYPQFCYGQSSFPNSEISNICVQYPELCFERRVEAAVSINADVVTIPNTLLVTNGNLRPFASGSRVAPGSKAQWGLDKTTTKNYTRGFGREGKTYLTADNTEYDSWFYPMGLTEKGLTEGYPHNNTRYTQTIKVWLDQSGSDATEVGGSSIQLGGVTDIFDFGSRIRELDDINALTAYKSSGRTIGRAQPGGLRLCPRSYGGDLGGPNIQFFKPGAGTLTREGQFFNTSASAKIFFHTASESLRVGFPGQKGKTDRVPVIIGEQDTLNVVTGNNRSILGPVDRSKGIQITTDVTNDYQNGLTVGFNYKFNTKRSGTHSLKAHTVMGGLVNYFQPSPTADKVRLGEFTLNSLERNLSTESNETPATSFRMSFPGLHRNENFSITNRPSRLVYLPSLDDFYKGVGTWTGDDIGILREIAGGRDKCCGTGDCGSFCCHGSFEGGYPLCSTDGETNAPIGSNCFCYTRRSEDKATIFDYISSSSDLTNLWENRNTNIGINLFGGTGSKDRRSFGTAKTYRRLIKPADQLRLYSGSKGALRDVPFEVGPTSIDNHQDVIDVGFKRTAGLHYTTRLKSSLELHNYSENIYDESTIAMYTHATPEKTGSNVSTAVVHSKPHTLLKEGGLILTKYPRLATSGIVSHSMSPDGFVGGKYYDIDEGSTIVLSRISGSNNHGIATPNTTVGQIKFGATGSMTSPYISDLGSFKFNVDSTGNNGLFELVTAPNSSSIKIAERETFNAITTNSSTLGPIDRSKEIQLEKRITNEFENGSQLGFNYKFNKTGLNLQQNSVIGGIVNYFQPSPTAEKIRLGELNLVNLSAISSSNSTTTPATAFQMSFPSFKRHTKYTAILDGRNREIYLPKSADFYRGVGTWVGDDIGILREIGGGGRNNCCGLGGCRTACCPESDELNNYFCKGQRGTGCKCVLQVNLETYLPNNVKGVFINSGSIQSVSGSSVTDYGTVASYRGLIQRNDHFKTDGNGKGSTRDYPFVVGPTNIDESTNTVSVGNKTTAGLHYTTKLKSSLELHNYSENVYDEATIAMYTHATPIISGNGELTYYEMPHTLLKEGGMILAHHPRAGVNGDTSDSMSPSGYASGDYYNNAGGATVVLAKISSSANGITAPNTEIGAIKFGATGSATSNTVQYLGKIDYTTDANNSGSIGISVGDTKPLTVATGSVSVTGSFTVNDLLNLLANFGNTGVETGSFGEDINLDGQVNVNDLLLTLAGNANPNIICTDLTLPPNVNHQLIGPEISICDGTTFTIPTGTVSTITL